MEPKDEPNPWIGVAVRFAFGAVFGALIGLGWFAHAADDGPPVWFWMGLGAVLCGILAAKMGDDFWHNITSW